MRPIVVYLHNRDSVTAQGTRIRARRIRGHITGTLPLFSEQKLSQSDDNHEPALRHVRMTYLCLDTP